MPKKDRTFSFRDVKRIYFRHLTPSERDRVKKAICGSSIYSEPLDPLFDMPPEYYDPSDPTPTPSDPNAPHYRTWVSTGKWSGLWQSAAKLIDMYHTFSRSQSTIVDNQRNEMQTTLGELNDLVINSRLFLIEFRQLISYMDTVRPGGRKQLKE